MNSIGRINLAHYGFRQYTFASILRPGVTGLYKSSVVVGRQQEWDGFGNREIRLVSAASARNNQVEAGRRTNIASGTGLWGRS